MSEFKVKEFQDFYLALVGGKPEYLFSQCTTKEQQDTYGLNIGDYLNDRVQFAWLTWQEQQKKIDVLQKLDDAVRQIIKNKKEVLSGFKNPNEWDECTEIQYSIAELEKALQGTTDA